MAMLQMMDITQGRISIDDVDISTLHPDDVRSRLNVVPQEPYYIPGSVRFNLDPQQISSCETIRDAVQKVDLWERISMSGGLDKELITSEWLHGERQLIVDEQTEAIIQNVIDSEFNDRTILSVHTVLHTSIVSTASRS
ncbi:hypothetical protein F4779DRAFT_622495 [Xylariaceae sp. FL0662B]|nr:hypothetical protein F4779DRAFT_622495 [Xylariaceae sp. FL0662B]